MKSNGMKNFVLLGAIVLGNRSTVRLWALHDSTDEQHSDLSLSRRDAARGSLQGNLQDFSA